MKADLVAAHARLIATLEDLRLSGCRVPCMDAAAEQRPLWTSEEPDEQDAAARACVGCSGFTACQQYINATPSEFGVYAASTDRDRRRRPGRPRKANTKESAA